MNTHSISSEVIFQISTKNKPEPASKTLNITASAISHSIASLEEEFGHKLFKKVGRQIYLTHQGKRFFEYAEELINLTRKISGDMQAKEIEWQDSFRIGASHLIAANYVCKSWADIKKIHPKLELQLFSLRSAEVVQQTAKGELDLGICMSPFAHPELNIKKLFESQLHITLRKNHPLAKLEIKKQLAELSKYSFCGPKAFQGIEVCEKHPILNRFEIQIKPDFVYDSYEVVLEYLQHSDSWALIPHFVIEDSESKYTIINPKSWDAKANVSAVWPRNRYLPKPLEMLVEVLKR